MAIDDNTSYELTGYQVKDLAGRIRLKADASAIPTVNDATLTIQHNGTSAGTFTANQSTNSTVNIETIYADTPGTATTPAASVQASDIVWSTMPGSYSTTEQVTPFTWIDGKPIYRKTYSMGALINGGGTLTQNVSSLNFETVVELRGIAINPTTKNVRPLPLVSNTLSDMVRLDVTNNEIRVVTTAGASWPTTYNAYVTLWYTKTTD